jgi:2'-5' RNA ligase
MSRPLDARRALASDRGDEVARVRVDSVALYHSRLSPKGPGYTPLARAKLN